MILEAKWPQGRDLKIFLVKNKIKNIQRVHDPRGPKILLMIYVLTNYVYQKKQRLVFFITALVINQKLFYLTLPNLAVLLLLTKAEP